ncbi:MAG: hypothetical protein RRE78_10440 [Acidianus sp.]|nr:hypothetical protein [Acidianus sp.]
MSQLLMLLRLLILATVIPTVNSLLFLPIGDIALFLAYILLPPITAIGL